MEKIRCLVTAGPTREYFDPVRFISNPSSGKMGLEIAKAARDFGWNTTLILGPVAFAHPENIKTFDVVSADDMLLATRREFENCDILIMTAAVSDMRPKCKADVKVKKESLSMTVEFEQTPDILRTLSKEKKNQILIGFAAETNDVKTYAKGKLVSKNLDAIAANDVSKSGSGFASDNNEITLILKDEREIYLGKDSKSALAKKLIEVLKEQFFPTNS